MAGESALVASAIHHHRSLATSIFPVHYWTFVPVLRNTTPIVRLQQLLDISMVVDRSWHQCNLSVHDVGEGGT